MIKEDKKLKIKKIVYVFYSIFYFSSIFYTAVIYRFLNPKLSETQLFIDNFHILFPASIFYIILVFWKAKE